MLRKYDKAWYRYSTNLPMSNYLQHIQTNLLDGLQQYSPMLYAHKLIYFSTVARCQNPKMPKC